MTKEEYKQLNEYLNECFLYLKDCDSFFVDNICIISNINNCYYEKCKKYNLERYDINNHLTYEDVYILAREIIEHIDCEYLKDYDNLITSMILVLIISI